MDIYHIIELLLIPLTSIVTWLATRRKRRNDAICELQDTIDMLVLKNGTIYKELLETRKELIETRKELADARVKIAVLEANQEKMFGENNELRTLIGQLQQPQKNIGFKN